MSRILPDYNQLMRFTINDVCNWLAEVGKIIRDTILALLEIKKKVR